MSDSFHEQRVELTSPCNNGFSIVPSDAVDLSRTTRGIYVGSSGDLNVTTKGGDTVTLKNLAAGIVHPLRVSRVWATGTTATDIVGVY